VHPADHQHRGDVVDAEAQSHDRHGPDAAAHHAADAGDLRRDHDLLPGRPGPVLGHQRRAGPAPAVVVPAPLQRRSAEVAGFRQACQGQGLTAPGGLVPGRPVSIAAMDSPDPVAPAVDTIVAIATAAGAAGIGVVRLSGPAALDIAAAISGGALQPRRAHYRRFQERDGTVLDDGIALAFPAPASYTGEDVAELQAHR